MSGIELKPCPFCGEPAAMQDAYLSGIMRSEPNAYCGKCSFSLPVRIWNTRSQSERERRLEEALKPFAEIAAEFDVPVHKKFETPPPDNMIVCGESYLNRCFNVGHFRAARSALNPTPEGSGNG